MKLIKSIDLYTKTKYVYQLDETEQNKTAQELAQQIIAPFGYSNECITKDLNGNINFNIVVYND